MEVPDSEGLKTLPRTWSGALHRRAEGMPREVRRMGRSTWASIPSGARILLGVSLAASSILVGAGLLALAVAAWGRYPTGLSGPVSVVLSATGGILILLAILTVSVRPRIHREGIPRYFGIVALAVGAAGLLAFALLVLANLSVTQDHTLPSMARFVPVGLGIVAALLGVLGIATSRGDSVRIRTSAAALVMGLGSALVPLWLWGSHCYLFEGIRCGW